MSGTKEKYMSSNIIKESDIISSFNAALIKKENINEDGSINWNFVDADIYLDLLESNMTMPPEYPDIFNRLIDEFLAKD